MDSGFGPYSLTRLCYETGGIFFAVHPNRDERREVSRRETAVLSAQLSFFDPDHAQLPAGLRVDQGISKADCRKQGPPCALVEAAEMSWLTPMERHSCCFPRSTTPA